MKEINRTERFCFFVVGKFQSIKIPGGKPPGIFYLYSAVISPAFRRMNTPFWLFWVI